MGLTESRSLVDHLILTVQTKEVPETLQLIFTCSELKGGMNIAPIQFDVSHDPIFMKSRPIPFGLRDAVQEEIAKLAEEEILRPIESSQWATPIVTPLKADGKPRLCGDFKVTVNPHLKKKSTTAKEPADLFIELQRPKGQRPKVLLESGSGKCFPSDSPRREVSGNYDNEYSFWIVCIQIFAIWSEHFSTHFPISD